MASKPDVIKDMAEALKEMAIALREIKNASSK